MGIPRGPLARREYAPVSHGHGPAATLRVPTVVARLHRLSPTAVQPASAAGAPSASRAWAATAARPRIPGGRHRSRPSRGDAAYYPPGPGMTGPRATPGWDADQAVAVLYDTHYCALTRLAALLVLDVAAAEEIVQAAFAAMHGGWRHLRDSDKALAYLLRKVVIGARSHHAASPAPPSRQPALPQAGQPPITAPQALVAALHALPARQREALVLRYYAGLPEHPDRRCDADQRTRGDRPHRAGPVVPPGCPQRRRSFQSGSAKRWSCGSTQICPAGGSPRL